MNGVVLVEELLIKVVLRTVVLLESLLIQVLLSSVEVIVDDVVLMGSLIQVTWERLSSSNPTKHCAVASSSLKILVDRVDPSRLREMSLVPSESRWVRSGGNSDRRDGLEIKFK